MHYILVLNSKTLTANSVDDRLVMCSSYYMISVSGKSNIIFVLNQMSVRLRLRNLWIRNSGRSDSVLLVKGSPAPDEETATLNWHKGAIGPAMFSFKGGT